MTLWEIKENYLSALENLTVNEDGEIENIEELEQVEGDFKEKAEALALFIQSELAMAESFTERLRFFSCVAIQN